MHAHTPLPSDTSQLTKTQLDYARKSIFGSKLSKLPENTVQLERWLGTLLRTISLLLQGRGKPRTEKQPAGFAVAIKELFYEKVPTPLKKKA